MTERSSDLSGRLRAAWLWFVTILVLGVGGWLLYSPATDDESPEERFIAERAIPPQLPTMVTQVKSLHEVGNDVKPDDLVLGVTIDDQSRAYPLGMLTLDYARKILNDELGEIPILITWCDACHDGIVFRRVIQGQPAKFGVFGSRWKENMTLHDETTGSVWSQYDGEARLGPLKGTRLDILPSVVTDWKTWKEQCPNTTVAWFEGKHDPIMTSTLYQEPERFVLGIAEARRAKSWSLADLTNRLVINDDWQHQPVVAMLVPGGVGARLYSRELEDKVLTFEARDGVPTDRETGSSWNPLTGKAVAGELTGKSLRALPAYVAFREAWSRFYPRSR